VAVRRILFAAKQHFEIGGIETSADQLARRLIARGHEVGVLAAPRTGSQNGGRRSRLELVDGYDYPAWAAHQMAPGAALAEVLWQFRPDIVVVKAGGRWWHDWTRPLVRAAQSTPCVLYVCDREAVELLSTNAVRPDAVWTVADSHTAAVRETSDYDAITVPSLVEPDLYRTDPAGEIVLYVNPVKSKGLLTAITLAAARRDIPFVFLRSWRWSDERFSELAQMASTLGNIELVPPTPDPREYYSRARLLLAPYDDLGRPRTVAEAQLSGIPVLSLDEAGNREAVGPGGILVARDAPMPEWIAALSRMWDDPDEHRRLSAAARAHSERPDMQPERIVALVEQQIERIIEAVNADSASAQRRARAEPKLVTVVLPVLNAADTIDEQLSALSEQTYNAEWELVVSDNGSTDQTRARVLSWEGGFPARIRIVDASTRRGVAHARNVGIEAARGHYILICDADDIVTRHWIERMVEALHDHEIVSGAGEHRLLNTPDQYEWTGDSDRDGLDIGYAFKPHASGGNLGVRRDVALGLAGFDESLRRAEDIDWSWRAQYAGHTVAFEPAAVIHYRRNPDLRAIARTRFRGGMVEPLLYRRHREHGMEAESWDDVRATWGWLAQNALAAWQKPELRIRWVDHAANRVGRVVGSIRHRARFL
jgi:glycosyltransferase involved in cell wall biosynthesis/GT2 family glycosyltransferase